VKNEARKSTKWREGDVRRQDVHNMAGEIVLEGQELASRLQASAAAVSNGLKIYDEKYNIITEIARWQMSLYTTHFFPVSAN
jgi:hypothetical protein